MFKTGDNRFMQEGFYKKSEVPENTKGLILISQDIVFVPRETKFGFSFPVFENLLIFLGVKNFLKSHAVFNLLGLSTQVPAKVVYLIDRPLPVLSYDFKWRIIEVADDKSIFEKFSKEEYMFVEALSNYENIVYDENVYRNRLSLIRGIFKQIDSKKMDVKKILTQAVKENPKIKEVLPKDKRKLC